jgi:hypothetical protein
VIWIGVTGVGEGFGVGEDRRGVGLPFRAGDGLAVGVAEGVGLGVGTR